MNAKNYILPYFPMICDKNFTNDEKLKFIVKAMTEYAQALQLLQPDVSGCCVHRVCDSCNQEYKVDLQLTADKTQAVQTFQNCPNCGKRDDVWIRINNCH